MSESRTKNTKRNIVFSYVETFASIAFAFISRTLIVRYLGDEFLGLSSLFSSILQVLCMAELGFSSAIVYNMYKPLAEGNVVKVCALLSYYRKVYRIVGCSILVIGIGISPFLPYLIHGDIPKDVNLYVVYFIFLANTAASYFAYAYKTALLEALQRLDLTKKAYFFVGIAQYILQIVMIILTKNYVLYIIIMVFTTIAKNITVAWIASKRFPQYHCEGEIDETTRKDIFKRVRGLLVGNISSVTYTTLDSIILSSLIGLTAVAIYNNYFMICSHLLSLVVLIRNAMQASVGNSVAKESVEKNYKDMLMWQFMFAMIASWCVTCMMSIYQPFMTLWMGEERLLSIVDVILLCMWFFTITAQHSFFLYLSGNGLWWEMRWPYIMSSVCNLILNIVLGKTLGITGILLASLISSSIFGLIWQCTILFKNYFGKSPLQFYFRELIYLVVCIVSSAVAFYLNSFLQSPDVIGLIIRGIISTAVFAVISYLFFFRTKIFREVKTFVYRAVKKA